MKQGSHPQVRVKAPWIVPQGIADGITPAGAGKRTPDGRQANVD